MAEPVDATIFVSFFYGRFDRLNDRVLSAELFDGSIVNAHSSLVFELVETIFEFFGIALPSTVSTGFGTLMGVSANKLNTHLYQYMWQHGNQFSDIQGKNLIGG